MKINVKQLQDWQIFEIDNNWYIRSKRNHILRYNKYAGFFNGEMTDTQEEVREKIAKGEYKLVSKKDFYTYRKKYECGGRFPVYNDQLLPDFVWEKDDEFELDQKMEIILKNFREQILGIGKDDPETNRSELDEGYKNMLMFDTIHEIKDLMEEK